MHTTAEKTQFLRERVRTPDGEGSICEVDLNDITVPFRVRLDDGDLEWHRPDEIVFLGDRGNFLASEMRRLTDPKARAREIFLEELRSFADMAVSVEQNDEPERGLEQLERQRHILLVLAGLE